MSLKISDVFPKKTINTYLRLKIPYTQHKFKALNTYLLSFLKKLDAKIYIFLSPDKNRQILFSKIFFLRFKKRQFGYLKSLKTLFQQNLIKEGYLNHFSIEESSITRGYYNY